VLSVSLKYFLKALKTRDIGRKVPAALIDDFLKTRLLEILILTEADI
jgi:hypothetical protein